MSQPKKKYDFKFYTHALATKQHDIFEKDGVADVINKFVL